MQSLLFEMHLASIVTASMAAQRISNDAYTASLSALWFSESVQRISEGTKCISKDAKCISEDAKWISEGAKCISDDPISIKTAISN